jgi:hypothetical protein
MPPHAPHSSSCGLAGGAASAGGSSSGAASPYTPSVVRNLPIPSTVRSPLYSASVPSGLGGEEEEVQEGMQEVKEVQEVETKEI